MSYASGSMLDLVGKGEMDTANMFLFSLEAVFIHHVSRETELGSPRLDADTGMAEGRRVWRACPVLSLGLMNVKSHAGLTLRDICRNSETPHRPAGDISDVTTMSSPLGLVFPRSL